MIYKVMVTETQRRTIWVEANTPDEAERRAEEAYDVRLVDMNESDSREWDCKSLGEYVCPGCGGNLVPSYGDAEDEDETGEDYYWYPDWLTCGNCGHDE